MTRFDPSHHASSGIASPGRRRAAAICLILAPVATLVGAAAWPAGSDGSTTDELAAAAGQPVMWTVASLLDLLPWLLLTAGAIGLLGYLRNRGRTLGMIGTISVAGGAVATAVVSGINLIVVPALAAESDRAAAARFLDGATGAPAAGLFVLLIYVGLIGTVLLSFGAMRGGLVRWWVPVLLVVGVVVTVVLSNGLSGIASAATYLPYAVAGVLLGLALLRADAAASPMTAPTRLRAPEEVTA